LEEHHLKKESRILLHIRLGDLEFIAVLRGFKGIEHLRILRGRRKIREIVETISSEKFFGEVRYIVTNPPQLSEEWRDALERIGRGDIEVDPRIRGEIGELVETYSKAFERLEQALNRLLLA